ncbi:MAG: hypothetical protein M0016_04890 [Deltaproteobacteria bacterium]|jgi:hypothetical protein|nr:hypothetical protein [Deltaproteobacteria bacterium]MCL5879472.1 hypothetical protein [Deltaproteobacteria bacterium]MDA8304486.1 hypothetical protein [Deltaproteobacteria bacterium]
MVQGVGNGLNNGLALNSVSSGENLFQTNQANANKGNYQNIAGPNDVYNKTAALTLNTIDTLNQGLVNALNESVANLNQNTAANNNNANGNVQYNGNGQATIGITQTGNILNKIV